MSPLEQTGILGILGVFVALVALYFLTCLRILTEYERGVVFRLGRVLGAPKGPGLVLVFWPIDWMERVSLRTVVTDVPPQDVITRDNVSVRVNAVVYFRVVDPMRSIIEVENYLFATNEMSQTTLRSIVGQVDLDELLAEREKINWPSNCGTCRLSRRSEAAATVRSSPFPCPSNCLAL